MIRYQQIISSTFAIIRLYLMQGEIEVAVTGIMGVRKLGNGTIVDTKMGIRKSEKLYIYKRLLI